MGLFQKFEIRKIIAGILAFAVLANGCATTSKTVNLDKKPKSQVLENIKNSYAVELPPNSKIVRSKLESFKKALSKKNLTEQDWRLHDELLGYYSVLKKNSQKIVVPANSKLSFIAEAYCLNSNKSAPSEKEVYRWQKSSPQIKYFRELLALRRQGIISQADLQGLLWSLQNETRWEEFPEKQKVILQLVDKNVAYNLPSNLKDKAVDLFEDQVISIPGASEAIDQVEFIKGKYYTFEDYNKSVESLVSKHELSNTDELTKIPETELFTQSQSDGYEDQEVSLFNPTQVDQEIDLSEYYLQPEREDVQRIGLNPRVNDDPALLGDLENVLYESMLRLGIGFTPGVNDVADIYELFSGKDFLTGNKLSYFERALSGVGVIAGSGQAYRYANRVLNAPAKYLPEFEKGIERIGGKALEKIEVNTAKNSLGNSKLRHAKSYTAEEINTRHIEVGNQPPYKIGTRVSEIESINGEKWVRVHGGNNEIGKWIVREEAVSGLNPDQIKMKYSLPKIPTHISDVSPPAGTKILRGRVTENFGGKAGAIQYEINLPREQINTDWFSNKRVLR